MFYTATGDLSFPLGIGEELDLRGSTFTEMGSLAETDDTGPGILEEGSLRLSVGFGVNFRSPLGPIRLDFSRALLKEDFDRTEDFRFSFGTRF